MASTLGELRQRVVGDAGLRSSPDFADLVEAFLRILPEMSTARIVSPTDHTYIFFQFGASQGFKITRPLNSSLFIESPDTFRIAFKRFMTFLAGLRSTGPGYSQTSNAYIVSREIDRVVYTIQQSIGCIGDSFESANQARKRVGQLFEALVALTIREVGLVCESRVVQVPIPGFPGYRMPYQLDLVISRKGAIITAEHSLIHSTEVVGSVKTTSKDRIDKVFLDKYLLTKLLGRDVPVIAIFLHDVQRAKKQGSEFGINSTFKSNHFLGYTVALTRLDGVYYVDPRPEMARNDRLREQIRDFQQLLTTDLWNLLQ